MEDFGDEVNSEGEWEWSKLFDFEATMDDKLQRYSAYDLNWEY